MTTNQPASRMALRQQAIAWLVEWRSGQMSDAQRDGLARWRQANPAHEAAWLQVSSAFDRTLCQPLAPLAGDRSTASAAMDALLQPHTGRRRRQLVGGTLAAVGVVVSTGMVAHRFSPLPGLLADVHTATAERRSLALSDGSRLLLDARTALDITYGAGQRRIDLQRGALIADMGARRASPFVVSTQHGAVRAQGARCMVRVQAGGTQVAALDHSVSLDLATQSTQTTLAAGQSALLDAQGTIQRLQTPAQDLAAWQQGMLAVRDGTLGEVIEGLRPYRRGLIRLSPAAAQLPVLGVFTLDDTDHTLQALADTLPVVVRRYQGGWLVVIEPIGHA